MVYHDISSDSQPQTNGRSNPSADLLDRFFSFLIDYFVISPFVLFGLFLCFQDEFIFLKQNPVAPENIRFQLICGFCFVVVFSLIQTIFVSVFKGTPGQYYLKIKFETESHTSNLYFRIFFRQILFWFSFALLCLPFLSMLTNRKKRTFYDQIADVTVVTLKNDNIYFAFEHEYKYWQALQMTLTLFIGGLVVALVGGQYQAVVYRQASFEQLNEKGFFCKQLEQFDLQDRLQAAVALNLVDQLPDDCLRREADFVLWRQQTGEIDMAYWAKSLLTEDEAKQRLYSQKACQADAVYGSEEKISLACRLAYAFSKNEFDQLIQNLDESKFLGAVLRYELMHHLYPEMESTEGLAAIEKFQQHKLVKKYLISEMLTNPNLTIEPHERAPASLIDGASENESREESPLDRAQQNKIIEMLGEL